MQTIFSIDVNRVLFNILSKMKDNLTRQIGEKATYTLVMQVLLKEHYSIPHFKEEIETLKKELETKTLEHTQFMKDLLLKKENMIAIPYSTLPQMAANLSLPPPPPPKARSKIDLSKIKTNKEVQDAFKKEKMELLDGTIRKPSEILVLAKPAHINAKIERIEDKMDSLVKELKEQGKTDKEIQDKIEEEQGKIIIDLDEKSSVIAKPDFFARTEKDVDYVFGNRIDAQPQPIVIENKTEQPESDKNAG